MFDSKLCGQFNIEIQKHIYCMYDREIYVYSLNHQDHIKIKINSVVALIPFIFSWFENEFTYTELLNIGLVLF